jgi:hypothetical protein
MSDMEFPLELGSAVKISIGDEFAFESAHRDSQIRFAHEWALMQIKCNAAGYSGT